MHGSYSQPTDNNTTADYRILLVLFCLPCFYLYFNTLAEQESSFHAATVRGGKKWTWIAWNIYVSGPGVKWTDVQRYWQQIVATYFPPVAKTTVASSFIVGHPVTEAGRHINFTTKKKKGDEEKFNLLPPFSSKNLLRNNFFGVERGINSKRSRDGQRATSSPNYMIRRKIRFEGKIFIRQEVDIGR